MASSLNQVQRLLLERAGDTASVSHAVSVPWTSVTFSGEKHQVTMLFTDTEHARLFIDWVDDDSKVDINLIGFALADLCVVEEDEIETLGHVYVTVTALTLNQ